MKHSVVLAVIALSLLLPSTTAQASRADDWTFTISDNESWECAAAKAAKQRTVKSRAPRLLVRQLARDVQELCAVTVEGEAFPNEEVQQIEPTDSPSVWLPAKWRKQQLDLLNATRAKKGLPPMRECARLEKAAQKHAKAMATNGFYGHYSPNGSTIASRIQNEGYRGRSYAENIHRGRFSLATAFEGWVRSTGHYGNLIHPRLTHVGFGASRGKDGDIYWVQNFGAGGVCR